MVRRPAVAGQFYPGGEKQLLKALDAMIPSRSVKIDAIGAVSPHAGYTYSGHVAGEVYGRIRPKDTYVVLSPNHTGAGARFAASADTWETPLGKIDVDADLLSGIMRNTDLVKTDPAAHISEHSIEVQLPFIQKIAPAARIVPITVQYGDITEYEEVADAIAGSVKDLARDATVIASSDMSHYESRASASGKDKLAIQAVLDLDEEALLDVVEEKDISMCGCIPAAMMIMYAKKQNAKKAELVKYADSGDVTGDTDQVVGYAGIIVY